LSVFFCNADADGWALRVVGFQAALDVSAERHGRRQTYLFLVLFLAKKFKTHKTTPAMAAGVTDRFWEIEDIVEVLEALEHTIYSRQSYALNYFFCSAK